MIEESIHREIEVTRIQIDKHITELKKLRKKFRTLNTFLAEYGQAKEEVKEEEHSNE